MWQRWNGTSHIFEKSDDNGSSWAPLPLSATILTEGILNDNRLSGNIAKVNYPNLFTFDQTIHNAGLAFSGSTAIPGPSLWSNTNILHMRLGTGGFKMQPQAGGADLFLIDNTGLITNNRGGASRRGSVIAPHATPVSLFALDTTDQVALYLVRVGIGTGSSDAFNYGSFATVAVEGNSARIVANNASTVQITLSGMTVVGQQGAGATTTMYWVALKIV